MWRQNLQVWLHWQDGSCFVFMFSSITQRYIWEYLTVNIHNNDGCLSSTSSHKLCPLSVLGAGMFLGWVFLLFFNVTSFHYCSDCWVPANLHNQNAYWRWLFSSYVLLIYSALICSNVVSQTLFIISNRWWWHTCSPSKHFLCSPHPPVSNTYTTHHRWWWHHILMLSSLYQTAAVFIWQQIV